MLDQLKQWARDLKRDVVALWLAARDPRVPLLAKATAAVVAGYALSPIDLIPDVIPVLGYLDDVIVVPLGIMLAVKLIPAEVMADLRVSAANRARPTSRGGLLAIVLLWIAALGVATWFLWRRSSAWG